MTGASQLGRRPTGWTDCSAVDDVPMTMRLFVAGCLTAAAVMSVASGAAAAVPLCLPAAPQTLRYSGLPSRIPAGLERIFVLRRLHSDWNVVGEPTVSRLTQRTGESFFSDAVEPPEPLFLQLDSNDTPVVIRTTYIERRLLPDGTQATCAKVLEQLVRGYRHLLIPKQCEDGA
jgi:hypothetical protein